MSEMGKEGEKMLGPLLIMNMSVPFGIRWPRTETSVRAVRIAAVVVRE